MSTPKEFAEEVSASVTIFKSERIYRPATAIEKVLLSLSAYDKSNVNSVGRSKP